MLEDLEAKDDDVVEVNSKASVVDGHLQQKHFSPRTPPSVDSTTNGNGNGSGSGNTDFISTKINLVSCQDVHTLHPMPSAGGSAQLNTNLSNIENQRHHSEQAGTDDFSRLFLHFSSYTTYLLLSTLYYVILCSLTLIEHQHITFNKRTSLNTCPQMPSTKWKMNAILPEETPTTKKDAKNLRNPISYHKIPTGKRLALLALQQREYSAQTHALPQNVAALHFTNTRSGRQSITPPQSTVFL
ncbi:hypothetical protein H5410_036960 [Solanum commersonii]|uniref:Uncharacterized protein n=1 Tax=Solanum commersonii TaxID=4109 RepID=A0A9J5Y852_SOLCO|nr:hypothetical protein H5410_036960 [Solanum commersonii]